MGQEHTSDAEVAGWLATLGIASLCQWDLLAFLYRHQTTLVDADDLARLLGYTTESVVAASVIGSDPLDELFGGGVFDGSVTMVVGVSGIGKTVLGTQLLLEGVRNQRRGMMVSLDEHPEQVMRNAETLGLNLREHLDSGMIQFFYDCPREIELDVHFARIAQTIEEHNIDAVASG